MRQLKSSQYFDSLSVNRYCGGYAVDLLLLLPSMCMDTAVANVGNYLMKIAMTLSYLLF
jgi:hypothetical protein